MLHRSLIRLYRVNSRRYAYGRIATTLFLVSCIGVRDTDGAAKPVPRQLFTLSESGPSYGAGTLISPGYVLNRKSRSYSLIVGYIRVKHSTPDGDREMIETSP